MRITFDLRPVWVLFLLMGMVAGGCSRTEYRLGADREAYRVIAERNDDSRWSASDYSIDMDPRSRYFDVYDPDKSPMPEDDPVSHEYMKLVDGRKGWEHWSDNGDRKELENPAWRESLAEYVEVDENGAVKLDVDSAVRLAYVHSPRHQVQLETLYLSALDVTEERFRLDTQFFGGYDSSYRHNGAYAGEVNRLGLGGDPMLQARRGLATAGDFLVGFANSFVFEFTSGDSNLASSLANFSLVQPLLRGAGRDIALEQLTYVERKLLAGLRGYGQFRQGFYTQVTIGELGVSGVQRFGGSTSLQSFSGSGGVGGYFGLLRQVQQIRNSEDNLNLQLSTLKRLEALYDNELIDLVQVDQFRQDIEVQRADVLDRTNSFKLSVDNYKTGTLGLPPNLDIELDQSLIQQFQLIPLESKPIRVSLRELQERISSFPDTPDMELINQVLNDCVDLIAPVEELFELAQSDLTRLEEQVPIRESEMTASQKETFRQDRSRLNKRFQDLEKGELGLDLAVQTIESLRDRFSEETQMDTLRGLTAWVVDFLQLVERLSLVPAQARLEMISVESIELLPEDAFRIALERRLDFMNGRASLVDSWRMLQVNADALQSVLDVTVSGDIGTARDNPVSFRSPTASLRMGLEFDAPLTRLLERNDYREALITYQRNRRELIQSHDLLEKGLLALLRNLEQRRQKLEIQRRAVTIAMRRVDQTQLALSAPPRGQLQPGQTPQISETTSTQLLGAQRSLQSTQNNFLSDWLSYYADRMRLYRELGVMELDSNGRWIEQPIEPHDSGSEVLEDNAEKNPLPPVIPAGWIHVGQFDRYPRVFQSDQVIFESDGLGESR